MKFNLIAGLFSLSFENFNLITISILKSNPRYSPVEKLNLSLSLLIIFWLGCSNPEKAPIVNFESQPLSNSGTIFKFHTVNQRTMEQSLQLFFEKYEIEIENEVETELSAWLDSLVYNPSFVRTNQGKTDSTYRTIDVADSIFYKMQNEISNRTKSNHLGVSKMDSWVFSCDDFHILLGYEPVKMQLIGISKSKLYSISNSSKGLNNTRTENEITLKEHILASTVNISIHYFPKSKSEAEIIDLLLADSAYIYSTSPTPYRLK